MCETCARLSHKKSDAPDTLSQTLIPLSSSDRSYICAEARLPDASMLSDPAISGSLTAAVLDKVAGRYQHLQMLFHRVAVGAGYIHHLAVGDPSMRFRQLKNLH